MSQSSPPTDPVAQPIALPPKPKTGIRSEFTSLLTLGVPMMGSQMAQMGMGVVDTVFAGRLSAQDLAGFALGGSVFWPLLLLFWGGVMAVTPSVAQLHGRNRVAECGELVRQALWVVALLSAILIVFLYQVGPLYLWLDADPAAVAIAVPYLRAAAWGVPGIMGYFALRYMVEGLGNTRPGLAVAVLSLLLKIPISYALVYGAFGLPKFGGVGCGIATAIVMWFEFAAMLFYILWVKPSYRQRTGLFTRFSWPDLKAIRRLLGLGVPIGLTVFLEMAIFSLTALLLGRFGSEVVAAHQIALNFGGVVFMIPLSLGMAATIRIGYLVGAGSVEKARLTGLAAIVGTWIYACLSLSLILLLRGWIAQLYTGGNNQAILDLTTQLLMFVALFQFFDATQATVLGALRGYKDAKIPLAIILFSYWCVALPIGICLGYGWMVPQLGVYGFWIGLVIGLGVVAVGAVLRFQWLSRNADRIRQLSAK